MSSAAGHGNASQYSRVIRTLVFICFRQEYVCPELVLDRRPLYGRKDLGAYYTVLVYVP